MDNTTSTTGVYKISALGWLCKLIDGKWIPLTQITPEQVRECQE